QKGRAVDGPQQDSLPHLPLWKEKTQMTDDAEQDTVEEVAKAIARQEHKHSSDRDFEVGWQHDMLIKKVADYRDFARAVLDRIPAKEDGTTTASSGGDSMTGDQRAEVAAAIRDVFAEITARAKPVCDPSSDDPKRVRHYIVPVGPIHRAAGKLGF